MVKPNTNVVRHEIQLGRRSVIRTILNFENLVILEVKHLRKNVIIMTQNFVNHTMLEIMIII